MGESWIRRRQMEQRTQQILHSALELFYEKGIDDTSIEEVAKAANVGTATIYRYFETKAELAISVGIVYWQEIADKYIGMMLQEEYRGLCGSRQLQQIFIILEKVLEEESFFFAVSSGI